MFVEIDDLTNLMRNYIFLALL